MTHKNQIKLINEAFNALPDMYDGFLDVRSRLFDMNLSSEREHRKHAPSSITHGISANIAAKLFTVQYLLNGWQDTHKWSIDDILQIRTEILYAQAYASRYYAMLADWVHKYSEPFKNIDYVFLMK